MGVKLYLSNLGMFLNTVALIVIPAVLIGMLIQMATVPDSTQVIDGGLVFADDDALEIFAGTAGLTSLISLFLGVLATAAITKAVADQYLGRSPSIADSLAFARGRWGTLLRMLFLEGLIVLLGLIALVIPGVYLFIAFTVAGPVLILEGIGARDSLRRSRNLVRGRWWPVLGVLILSALVNFLLGGILGLILQPVLEGVETVRTHILVTSLGDMITQILAAPLGAAVTVVLYFDLRARKEGFGLHDLQAATATPGGAQPQFSPPNPDPEGSEPR